MHKLNGKPFREVLPVSPEDKDRFLAFFAERPDGKCWNWTGGASNFGHDRFRVGGKLQCAHRIAFSIWKGDEIIREGRGLVLHACDNHSCCNPAHLRLGSYRENVMDMIARDRHPEQLRRPFSAKCRAARIASSLSVRGGRHDG